MRWHVVKRSRRARLLGGPGRRSQDLVPDSIQEGSGSSLPVRPEGGHAAGRSTRHPASPSLSRSSAVIPHANGSYNRLEALALGSSLNQDFADLFHGDPLELPPLPRIDRDRVTGLVAG